MKCKDSIKDLKEYKPSSLPFNIKLDANEGRSNILKDEFYFKDDFKFNFYPDSESSQLRKEIGKYLGVKESKIVAGNGSSEMIDLIMKAFVDKDDKILTFVPTFSMYYVYSKIYSANLIGVESEEDFSVDIDKLIEKEKEIDPKVIIICNPNNPTGYQISVGNIKKILEKTESLVVVDEAYIEFTKGSMINELKNYNNLVILRTFSKAFSLAGIRLGYMIANEDIIDIINKVKSPYNLNSITQYIGIRRLEKKDNLGKYIKEVKKERERVYEELKSMNFKVYKSSANFIFFKSDIKNLSKNMAKKGILIRGFSDDLKNHYRVSIGEKEENDSFIEYIKGII